MDNPGWIGVAMAGIAMLGTTLSNFFRFRLDQRVTDLEKELALCKAEHEQAARVAAEAKQYAKETRAEVTQVRALVANGGPSLGPA